MDIIGDLRLDSADLTQMLLESVGGASFDQRCYYYCSQRYELYGYGCAAAVAHHSPYVKVRILAVLYAVWHLTDIAAGELADSSLDDWPLNQEHGAQSRMARSVWWLSSLSV